MTTNGFPSEWKSALVLGLGRSGQAAIRLLRNHQLRVVAEDAGDTPQLQALADSLRHEGIAVRLGGHAPDCTADVVIVSPGVELNLPVLASARAQAVPIIGELELAARCWLGDLVAVTGTNGKSTVVTALEQMFRAAGRRPLLGGNVGIALSSLVERPEHQDADTLVAEVSSYQLETIDTFHPRVAVVLNIEPDHLKHHGTFQAYAHAKGRIALNQGVGDWLVLPRDLEDWRRQLPYAVPTCWFGHGDGPAPGIYARDNLVVWKGPECTAQWSFDNLCQLLPHQVLNCLAVAAVGLLSGLDPDCALSEFRAPTLLEHRIEPVAEICGVKFVNDSKATNVAAARVALLGQPDRSVVLIAGGIDKGEDFAPILPLLKQKVVACVLIGQFRQQLAQLWGAAVPCMLADSMPEAVACAARQAVAGQTVLLSPACASQDMFRDFEHRGHVFKAAVMQLLAASHAPDCCR